MALDETALEDPKRLDALHAYEILDTLPEPAFDRLAKLAAQICGTPYAAITFIVRERTFYKSKVGFTDGDVPGVLGFCHHGTLHADLLLVPDATQDERFASNQMVIGDAHVRFYAGMPLMTTEGHALGMLCVVDRIPRQLTREQCDALRMLAHEVLTELELRRTRKSLEEGTFRQDPVEFFGLLVKNLATALDVSGSTVAGGRVHALPLRRCGRRWDSVLRGYVPGRLLSPADDPGLRVEWHPDSTSL